MRFLWTKNGYKIQFLKKNFGKTRFHCVFHEKFFLTGFLFVEIHFWDFLSSFFIFYGKNITFLRCNFLIARFLRAPPFFSSSMITFLDMYINRANKEIMKFALYITFPVAMFAMYNSQAFKDRKEVTAC